MAESEWLRKNEIIALLSANDATAHDDADGGSGRGSKEYRGQLPHMADDQLAFFHALEKCFELNSIPRASWSRLLPPLLNPKAAKCYSQMSISDCKNYDLVKKTVVESFRLTSATYLQKFRSGTRSGAENYTIFSNRLDNLLS